MSTSPSGDMKFTEFCEFLNSIRGRGLVDTKTQKDKLTKFFRQIKAPCSTDEEFKEKSKDIISILLSKSNEVRKLELGEKKLTDLVSKVVGIKGLSSTQLKGGGTVAITLAKEVLKRMQGEPSTMTVKEVCKYLDECTENKKHLAKERAIDYFVNHCSEDELIWIFNTMMRNTETFLGMNRNAILECITPGASDVWKNTRDLGRITNRPIDVTEPDYFLGKNFCPQLLARLSLQTIDDQVKTNLVGGFFMELKYDGEHVILHKKGSNYIWYTRNGKDFTEHYGSHHKEKLAEQIHPVFKKSVEECILDCELMHYDEKRGKLVRHQSKAADDVILSYKDPQPGHRIVVVIFDLLYIAGKFHGKHCKEDLMQVTLEDRIVIMNDRLLKRNENYNIFIPDRSEGVNGDDIRRFYEEATQAGEEGVAIKRKNSLYFIGERTQRNGWFKLKEMFDIDLVIVGYMPAKDNRGSAFILAAWDDRNNNGHTLRVICKSYSGLKDIVKMKILDDARSGGKLLVEPPDCLIGRKDYQYFRPENYVAYGIRNGHLIDVVMLRIREDKSVCKEDIDDYKTIENHKPGQNDINPNRHRSLESSSISKLKRITKRSIFDEEVGSSTKQSKSTDSHNHSSNALKGKTICVLPSFDDNLRTKCWSILENFGAKVIANPTDSTDLVIAPSDTHMRVKTTIKKNMQNIIRADWLLQCQELGKVEPWKPSQIIHEVPGAFTLE